MRNQRWMAWTNAVVVGLAVFAGPAGANGLDPTHDVSTARKLLRSLMRTPWVTYTKQELEAEQARWETLSQEAEDDPTEMPAESENQAPVADSEITPDQASVTIDVFRKPVGLGVAKEFLVLSKDGIPLSAHVVSTAKAGKSTIGDGGPAKRSFMAKIEVMNPDAKYGDPLKVVDLAKEDLGARYPYPFHVSTIYHSAMYWGLNIEGSYWIHSTPHYRDLGKPASMGCVRVNFPTAMRLFDYAVNESKGNVAIHMHTFTSAEKRSEANRRWLELGLTAEWVEAHVSRDLADAHAQPTDRRGDYNGVAHGRLGQAMGIPSCGGVDCFETFRALFLRKHQYALGQPDESPSMTPLVLEPLPLSPKALSSKSPDVDVYRALFPNFEVLPTQDRE